MTSLLAWQKGMTMNNSAAYTLSDTTRFLKNGNRLTFLRDGDEEIEFTLESEVRSGDYFVTLATRLDELARSIPDYPTRARLEDVVSDLIYLQDRYSIAKKQD
jgi:hypothetical protein